VKAGIQLLLSSILLMASMSGAAWGFEEIGDIKLTDEDGREVTFDDYMGYRRVVFFGFAHCAHICPTTLANTGHALDALGERASAVRVLFVSVDPKRDTPAILKKYTERFHDSIIGLTGTYEAIEALAAALRISFGYNRRSDGKTRPIDRAEYEALPDSASYVPFHGTQTLILDENGAVIELIGYGSSPDIIAGKIATHLEPSATNANAARD